jgi:hypothetical protein
MKCVYGGTIPREVYNMLHIYFSLKKKTDLGGTPHCRIGLEFEYLSEFKLQFGTASE